MVEKKSILTQEMLTQIDHELTKFPSDQRKSASLMAIRIVQDLGNGSVTDEQLNAIADYLGVPHIALYEVATFYTMCKREKVGKHNIAVCTNVSCMINGAEEIVNHLEKKLNIKFGEVTADGKFSLEEVECMGACINAPMCQIGKKYYERLTEEKIDQILKEF